MKSWKRAFTILGIILILVSIYLLVYMVRVVAILAPTPGLQLFIFFAVAIAGIAGGVGLMVFAHKL